MNKTLWMTKAKEKGIEQFEIYESESISKELTWYQGKMDTLVSSHVVGVSMRGVIDGKMANIALEKVDDQKIDEVLQTLITQGKTISTKEEDNLRKPEELHEIKSNKKWKMADLAYVKTVIKSIEEKCLAYDPRILQVTSLSYNQSQGKRSITNTLGIDVQDFDQAQYIVCGVSAKENDDIKDDYYLEVIYDFQDFNIDAFVSKICTKALNKLGGKPIPSQACKVIFEKEAMTDLLSAFINLFNGELIYKGISCLKGKENTQIFSDQITLVDNPRNTDALSIANFDDEGCPTRSKTLVDHGIFTTMLHSTRSASRMHTESTGNGFKSGYASSVSVQPMNCNIECGTKSFDELCKIVQNGFVIESLQGLHAGIDFVTTNFSLQCSGYWIEDGKRAKNVTLVTVANNFLDMMKHVLEVGNDLDWSYHQICSPSIAFEQCTISGE